MNYLSLDISLIAILPAILLCIYVYVKDKVEKEPIGLLAILFFAGALAYIPVMLLLKPVTGWFDSIFADSMSFGADGTLTYSSSTADISHKLLCSFFGFALLQVIMKWLVLVLITKKSKHFNYMFDGIVYSMFVSLGFASCENICYAWINGWDRLALRTVTSLPSHLFVGIVMGYCYMLWHFYSLAQNKEKVLAERNVIEKRKIRSSVLWAVLSFLLPFLAQGIYSFAGSFTDDIVVSVFYIFVIITYVFCFYKIHRIALKDTAGNEFTNRLIMKFHPDIDKTVLLSESKPACDVEDVQEDDENA